MTDQLPTVDEFLDVVFAKKQEDELIYKGDYYKHAPALCNSSAVALYTNPSTFYPQNGGIERTDTYVANTYLAVLDDIGTKVKPNGLTPTYKITSSEGNEQWGYVFDRGYPLQEAKHFLRRIKANDLPLSDADALKGNQLIRLPKGINGKSEGVGKINRFKVHLTEWNPDFIYSIEDLVKAWRLPEVSELREFGNGIGLEDADDRELNRDQFSQALVEHGPAIEGQNGDHHTLSAAMLGRDLGLSDVVTLEIMSGEWNKSCIPEWDTEDLETKVSNAYKYAKGEFGNMNPISDFEGFDSDMSGELTGSELFEQFKALSVTHRLEEMKANLLNEQFIFPGLALSGQVTLFYAPPNTGKTLFFLKFIIEGIEKGSLKKGEVFYINADDSYKGIYTKAIIAAENGFLMISPSDSGKSSEEIIAMLKGLAKGHELRGKVVILDTLKKFVDMMSKTSQSKLFEVLRRISAKGGTVIIAGHTNKHPNADGQLVYEGTSDTLNDVDCAYSMYRMSDRGEEQQVVEFRLEKSRGNNIARVSYQYEKLTLASYSQLVNSVHPLSDREAKEVAELGNANEIIQAYEAEVVAIRAVLEKGEANQSSLMESIKKDYADFFAETSLRRLRHALLKLDGALWKSHRGTHHALIYKLIEGGVSLE